MPSNTPFPLMIGIIWWGTVSLRSRIRTYNHIRKWNAIGSLVMHWFLNATDTIPSNEAHNITFCMKPNIIELASYLSKTMLKKTCNLEHRSLPVSFPIIQLSLRLHWGNIFTETRSDTTIFYNKSQQTWKRTFIRYADQVFLSPKIPN